MKYEITTTSGKTYFTNEDPSQDCITQWISVCDGICIQKCAIESVAEVPDEVRPARKIQTKKKEVRK